MRQQTLQNRIRERRPLKGQATVEFAFVAIILMALVFGVLEVSRVVFINAEIDNAAREGAQYAALNPGMTQASLETVVKSKLTLVDPTLVTVAWPVTYAPVADARCKFCRVSVMVTYPWQSFVPLLKLGPITLRATATKLIEN